MIYLCKKIVFLFCCILYGTTFHLTANDEIISARLIVLYIFAPDSVFKKQDDDSSEEETHSVQPQRNPNRNTALRASLRQPGQNQETVGVPVTPRQLPAELRKNQIAQSQTQPIPLNNAQRPPNGPPKMGRFEPSPSTRHRYYGRENPHTMAGPQRIANQQQLPYMPQNSLPYAQRLREKGQRIPQPPQTMNNYTLEQAQQIAQWREQQGLQNTAHRYYGYENQQNMQNPKQTPKQTPMRTTLRTPMPTTLRPPMSATLRTPMPITTKNVGTLDQSQRNTQSQTQQQPQSKIQQQITQTPSQQPPISVPQKTTSSSEVQYPPQQTLRPRASQPPGGKHTARYIEYG